MGYCEGGDLHTKLRSQRGTLIAETQVVEWTIQISFGLQCVKNKKLTKHTVESLRLIYPSDVAASAYNPLWDAPIHPTWEGR